MRQNQPKEPIQKEVPCIEVQYTGGMTATELVSHDINSSRFYL